MNARTRQEAIARSLRRNGATTAEALATEVGVSRRTVLRDINVLRDEGFIINSDVGPGGGLHLDPTSTQATARLTVPEVFAVLISVATVRIAGNLPFAELADTGLAKIERALPANKVKDLRAFLECLHVGKLSPLQNLSDLGTMDPDLLPVFERAFLEQRCIHFDYSDAKGRFTQRTVEPQAMLILPPLWYLVAWDPSKQDFRHFRMDRIKNPSIIEQLNFRRRHVPFEDDVCPFTELAG